MPTLQNTKTILDGVVIEKSTKVAELAQKGNDEISTWSDTQLQAWITLDENHIVDLDDYISRVAEILEM